MKTFQVDRSYHKYAQTPKLQDSRYQNAKNFHPPPWRAHLVAPSPPTGLRTPNLGKN